MSARSQIAAVTLVAMLSFSTLQAHGDDQVPAPNTAAKAAAAKALSQKAESAKELSALMSRIDRGKAHLDRARKLKSPGLKIAALKKATLTLERTLATVTDREGDVYEVLAEETRSMLVNALNGRTKLELDQGRLDRAQKLNAQVRSLDARDKSALSLSKEISDEHVKLAPMVAPQNVLPTADNPPLTEAEKRARDYAAGFIDGLRERSTLPRGSFYGGYGSYGDPYYRETGLDRRLRNRGYGNTSLTYRRRNGTSRVRGGVGSSLDRRRTSASRFARGGVNRNSATRGYGEGGRVGTPRVRGGSGIQLPRFAPNTAAGGSVLGRTITKQWVYSKTGTAVLDR